MLLVRVETDAGLVGWGEAFGHGAIPATTAAMESLVAPWMIGRDAADIAGTMRAAQQAMHLYGRGGPVTYALSGVDIALWDLAGKAAGLPLHRLLGAAAPAAIPAYASLLRYGDPALVARNVGSGGGRRLSGDQAARDHPAGGRGGARGGRAGHPADERHKLPVAAGRGPGDGARAAPHRPALAGGAGLAARGFRRPRRGPRRGRADRRRREHGERRGVPARVRRPARSTSRSRA